MRLVFSRYVEADIRGILTDIQQHSETQAERVLSKLEVEIERIHTAPLQYQLRPEIGEEARLAVIERRYLILFRASEHRIRIERVVHGSRELASLYRLALENG